MYTMYAGDRFQKQRPPSFVLVGGLWLTLTDWAIESVSAGGAASQVLNRATQS